MDLATYDYLFRKLAHIFENIFFSVLTTLTADGVEYEVVFTVGYFSEVLKAFWSTDPDGLWDENSEVEIDLRLPTFTFYAF